MTGPIYRLTLRALLVQKRTLMLALVALAPVVTSLVFALARSPQDGVRDFYSTIVQQLFVPTVAALIALVFGVSAFGDEREDGTILYLVATPQPRFGLVVAKVAAAWTATLVLLVPSLVASAVLALGGQASLRLVGWPLLGVLLSSLAYCAASSWLSLMTRRPIVIGIIYILLWEGSIATFARVGGQALDLGLRPGVRGACCATGGSAGGRHAWPRAWCWRRWWRLPWRRPPGGW